MPAALAVRRVELTLALGLPRNCKDGRWCYGQTYSARFSFLYLGFGDLKIEPVLRRSEKGTERADD